MISCNFFFFFNLEQISISIVSIVPLFLMILFHCFSWFYLQIKSTFFFATCLALVLAAPAPKPAPKPGVVSYEGPLAPYIVPSVNPFAAPIVAAPAAAPLVAAPAYTPYATPYAASYPYVYPGYSGYSYYY